MTTGIELPVITTPERPAATISRERYDELARKVKRLSWLSLGAMTLEGVVAITAGIVAGSIALVGFGLDSAVEGFASTIIIWRFTGSRVFSQRAEHRAQRLVAIQFFILAPYVAYEAIGHLVGGEHPEVSPLGMVLTASSVIGMPLLGIAKQRVARQLGSQATHGEGTQNLLCAYLAAAVFFGLAGNALFDAWWLDPVAALVIAGIALREGVQTWRGEGCCAGPALDRAGNACADDCC